MCLAEGERRDVVWAWLVVQVAGLERGVKADFRDGDGWVGELVDWVRNGVVGGYHVLAFEAAAVDAGCEGAGSVPRRGEGVVTAFELGGTGFCWAAAVG